MSKWMVRALVGLSMSAVLAPPSHGQTKSERPAPWPTPIRLPPIAPPEPISDQYAFSGAMGFGARSMGGRGGRPIVVTTLADYGLGEPAIRGSLRCAVEEVQGPRIITFAVGGVIQLKRALKLRTPFVTIDGSTAPAPGITLHSWSMGIDNTHDIVIRYLRFRSNLPYGTNHGTGGERSLSITGQTVPCYDIIIDHCSIGLSDDDALSIWGNCYRVTIQWCLFGGDPHSASRGSLMGGDFALNYDEYVTFAYNLWTNFWQRNPSFGGPGRVDFFNNAVIGYLWGMELRPPRGVESPRINIINNCFILHRDYPWLQIPNPVIGESANLEQGTAYIKGNFYGGWKKDDWSMTGELSTNGTVPLAEYIRRTSPWPSPSLPEPAMSCLGKIYSYAGCNKPVRDATDESYIQNAKTGDILFPSPSNPNPGPK